MRMHCGNSLLRTEFVHEVGKHIKAYVVMPWIGYNIGKRIAGSKAFFHAVSKLCITFTFVPENSPSSQPKSSAGR